MNNDLYLVWQGVPLNRVNEPRLQGRNKDRLKGVVTEQGRPTEGLITVACCNTCHYPQTDRLTSYLLIIHDDAAHMITCVILLLDSPRIFVIAIPNHQYDSSSRSIAIYADRGEL